MCNALWTALRCKLYYHQEYPWAGLRISIEMLCKLLLRSIFAFRSETRMLRVLPIRKLWIFYRRFLRATQCMVLRAAWTRNGPAFRQDQVRGFSFLSIWVIEAGERLEVAQVHARLVETQQLRPEREARLLLVVLRLSSYSAPEFSTLLGHCFGLDLLPTCSIRKPLSYCTARWAFRRFSSTV